MLEMLKRLFHRGTVRSTLPATLLPDGLTATLFESLADSLMSVLKPRLQNGPFETSSHDQRLPVLFVRGSRRGSTTALISSSFKV